MGLDKPIVIGMAGLGALAGVAAVLVPILVLVDRDRAGGEPAPFATPTPVLEGVQLGQTGSGAVVVTPQPTTAAPEPTAPSGSETGGDPVAGRQVFQSAAPIPCQTCHTLDGSLSLGPSLQGLADRAATTKPGQSALDYVRESVAKPDSFVVEGFPPSVMPGTFGETLSPKQLDDLVAFLMTQ